MIHLIHSSLSTYNYGVWNERVRQDGGFVYILHRSPRARCARCVMCGLARPGVLTRATASVYNLIHMNSQLPFPHFHLINLFTLGHTTSINTFVLHLFMSFNLFKCTETRVWVHHVHFFVRSSSLTYMCTLYLKYISITHYSFIFKLFCHDFILFIIFIFL